jgi:hypothetical protein
MRDRQKRRDPMNNPTNKRILPIVAACLLEL